MAPPVRTFMDVSIGDAPPNRIIFELFVDKVPKTAENFRALCTGEKGISRLSQQALHYKGSIIHRLIPGFMAQGGDFTKRNGTGGESIYGGQFADEDLSTPVDKEGRVLLLVMANRGPDTNGSQFFITFAPSPHLNGKHCVFGRIVRGFEHVQAWESLQVDDRDRPLSPVTIVNCGELVLAKKAPEPKAADSRRSVSPSSTDSKSPRRKRRSTRSDSGSSASDSEDERRRRKKERKSKKKDKKRDKDGKKDKLKNLVGGYQETEEELDARLEREENERIAAAKKDKMERLKKQLEEERRNSSDGGVVYRGRGAMKYRDPETLSNRGSYADTDRSFGRPRAYDGVPRPEKPYYARHNGGGAGRDSQASYGDRHGGRDDERAQSRGDRWRRELSPRRDEGQRRARSRSRDRARVDTDDWRVGRKQTLEGRMADRSPVRFEKATRNSPSPAPPARRSPTPPPPARRSPSPAQKRRGEMLTDSESEMELDDD